jgi:hypothetical protein
MSAKKELNFLERVVARLKADDNSKINLAVDQIIKDLTKQIKTRERQIVDLNYKRDEQLVDLKEQLQEAIENKTEVAETFDLESITTNEARRAYVNVYTRNLQAAIDNVSYKEKQIEAVKESAENQVKSLQSEIDNFKTLLKEMN